MSEAQESDKRVIFERPVDARLMAIDGTWQRACKIHDVSEASAKLVMDGAVTDRGQKEFFLMLSPTGLAYRHCELSWVNGEFIGCNSSTGAELQSASDAAKHWAK